MGAWLVGALVCMAYTVTFGALQWCENHRHGRSGSFWAPVWWVMLTWPYWLVLVAVGAVRRTLRR